MGILLPFCFWSSLFFVFGAASSILDLLTDRRADHLLGDLQQFFKFQICPIFAGRSLETESTRLFLRKGVFISRTI